MSCESIHLVLTLGLLVWDMESIRILTGVSVTSRLDQYKTWDCKIRCSLDLRNPQLW